jgi:hypothetical protein
MFFDSGLQHCREGISPLADHGLRPARQSECRRGCRPSCASWCERAGTVRLPAGSPPCGPTRPLPGTADRGWTRAPALAVEQVWSPIVKHQRPAALGNQAISTIAHEEGRISPALSFPSGLAMPAASSMEAAGHAVAKTAGVGERCTMIEAATYAMAEAAAESGDT